MYAVAVHVPVVDRLKRAFRRHIKVGAGRVEGAVTEVLEGGLRPCLGRRDRGRRGEGGQEPVRRRASQVVMYTRRLYTVFTMRCVNYLRFHVKLTSVDACRTCHVYSALLSTSCRSTTLRPASCMKIPRPLARSRHGYFPGLVRLPSGQLLALFVIAEAFESADATTWVARSPTPDARGPSKRRSSPGRTLTSAASDYLKPTRSARWNARGDRLPLLPRRPGAGDWNPETGGILPGDDIVSFSTDEGRTWSAPDGDPPHLAGAVRDFRAPCVQIGSGELLAVGALTKLPDGSNPFGTARNPAAQP